jgi:hypothetical protein
VENPQETVEAAVEAGSARRKRGRPRGRPLAEEHRARIAAALAGGDAARRGWETRRARQAERDGLEEVGQDGSEV